MTKWRPENWVRDKRYLCNTEDIDWHCNIADKESQPACLLSCWKDFELGADAMLEVRDKWWIEKIEYQRDNICCIGQEKTLCPLDDPCCSFMKESCDWWQNLKKEMLND